MRNFDLIFVLCGTLEMLLVIYVSTYVMHRPSYEAYQSNPLLPTLSDATLRSSIDNEEKFIDIPFSKRGGNNETLEFKFTINFTSGQSALFRVVPDDCVEQMTINGQEVIQPQNRCNWRTGFVVDLNRLLHKGKNTVYVKVLNVTGITGLQFIPLPHIR